MLPTKLKVFDVGFLDHIFFVFVPVDLNKALGNTIDAHEAAQMHQNFSQQLLQDHIAACSLPEHNLISVHINLSLTFYL